MELSGIRSRRPAAVYLFAGSPGVGKTFFAETAAELLKLPFLRCDMSEYADKEAHMSFIGTNKVYKNCAPGVITSFVKQNPHSMILLDEIEKAHPVIIRLLLQLLDAGRLRDVYYDEEIDFSDVIIVMTTNAGRMLYESSGYGEFSAAPTKVVINAIMKDRDPVTGQPFFPPAVCSRLGAGNVVMFNSLPSSALRDISQRELLRHIAGYRELGLEIQFDRKLCSALLFSRGADADARTAKAAAASFVEEEIYELARLLSADKSGSSINKLNNVSIEIDTSDSSESVKELFCRSEECGLLVFSDSAVAERFEEAGKNCAVYSAKTLDEAKNILKTKCVSFIVVDPMFGAEAAIMGDGRPLDIEDAKTPAREFLSCAVSQYRNIPVFAVQHISMRYSEEERYSFLKAGVRDFIDLVRETGKLSDRLTEICGDIHEENGLARLESSCKVLTYKTSQYMKSDSAAVIKLFDLELVTALDAEDMESIMSETSRPTARFDDVIGAEDAKKELAFFVDYLKDPRKYIGSGLSSPKGVLLYGPPGTGKTLLAKAMAGEADVTILSTEGNRFLKKYVGEGSAAIHRLFAAARKYAPSIVFIDEIDSIGRDRSTSDGSSGNEGLLTALLTEMDGFNKDITKPVFVLAATNFSVSGGENRLDPALCRRFDRRIYVDIPTKDDRKKYLERRLSENPAFKVSEEFTDNIVQRSVGMSIAQLESIIELSLRMTVREGKLNVTNDIFNESFELFCSGEEKKWDEATMRRVAIHESGHTLITLLNGGHAAYVTISSRADFGGYMQQDSSENKPIRTKSEIISKIRTLLGGRAAEIVYYGETEGLSTGAYSDLQKACSLCRSMIYDFSMSSSIGFVSDERDLPERLREDVCKKIDLILKRELEYDIVQIRNNKHIMDRFVEKLINCNHMTQKEIEDAFEFEKPQAKNCT